MATVKAILYKYQQKADGSYPIYIRITSHGKQRYKNTGYSCELEDWDHEREQLKRSFDGPFEKINKLIRDLKEEALEAILDLQLARKFVSPGKIKQILNNTGSSNFFEFADKINQQYLKEDKAGTYIKTNTVLNELQSYVKSRSLMIGEIDEEFIIAFKKYLSKKNNINTVTGKLKKIRTILLMAMKHKPPLITENPFIGIKLEKKESNKLKLEEAQLLELFKCRLIANTPAYHCLNAFLFSFLCWGMRFRDVILFKKEYISGDRLYYTSRKNKKDFSIKIEGRRKQIIDYYLNHTEGEFLFPFMGSAPKKALDLEKKLDGLNSTINKNLKKIALLSGIPEFTFHIARHSFANRGKRLGIDPVKSMEMVGHGDYDTHKIYLSSFSEEDLDQQSELIYKDLY